MRILSNLIFFKDLAQVMMLNKMLDFRDFVKTWCSPGIEKLTNMFSTSVNTSFPARPVDQNVFLSTWIRKITKFVESGFILFLPPYTQGEKKNI